MPQAEATSALNHDASDGVHPTVQIDGTALAAARQHDAVCVSSESDDRTQ